MELTPELRTIILVVTPLILELIGLTFTVQVDPYINKKNRRLMNLVILFVFSLLAQQVLEGVAIMYSMSRMFRILLAMYGYVIRPVIIVMFFHIIQQDRRYVGAWILIIINIAVYSTSLFCDLAFTINEEGEFQRGPLGFTCLVISAILLIYLYVLSVRSNQLRTFKRSEAWIPVANVF